MPRVAWTKGECAQWIRQRALAALPGPVLWLYIGDDWTDEHACDVRSGQALTVRIGDTVPASKAGYRLPGVREVQQRLATLGEGAAEESRV